MQILFDCIFFSGIFYFFVRNRRFDFFTVGFFGGCFYFMPGLFGFLFAYDRFDLTGLSEGIFPETYLVMSLVLASLLVSAFFFDRKYKTPSTSKGRFLFEGAPENWAALLALVGFGFSLLTTGRHLLDADKVQMMLYLDRWSILWQVGATVGFVLAFARKNRRALGICMLLLLADWYVGFRADSILATISVVVYSYSAKGSIKLARQSKMLVLFGVLAALAFLYPPIGSAAKTGDWGQIRELLSSPNYYVVQLFRSEPFEIQTILNEVIGTNFRVGAGHLLSLFYVLVPFGNELGGKVVSFNDLFQPRLFPGVDWGMANNIWAQAWSIGGLLVVLIFLIIYVIGIWQGSRILLSQADCRRAFAALFFTPWAFYIYRNDLLYQLIMERRILLLFVTVVLAGIIWQRPRLRANGSEPPAAST